MSLAQNIVTLALAQIQARVLKLIQAQTKDLKNGRRRSTPRRRANLHPARKTKAPRRFPRARSKWRGLSSKEKKGLDGKVYDLANQLKALSVHFAGLPSNRRKVPISRAHVWCVRCKQLHHASNECPTWHPQVQMVDEELVDQYGSSLGEQVEFFYEESPNLVYQISAGPRNLHGRPTPSLARPADQNSGAGAASRLAMIVCYNRSKLGHYFNNCPEPKKQEYGIPPALCAICKREGHTTVNCPMAASPKLILNRGESSQPAASKAPGETTVSFIGMEWQEENEEKEQPQWEFSE